MLTPTSANLSSISDATRRGGGPADENERGVISPGLEGIAVLDFGGEETRLGKLPPAGQPSIVSVEESRSYESALLLRDGSAGRSTPSGCEGRDLLSTPLLSHPSEDLGAQVSLLIAERDQGGVFEEHRYR